jgi:anti-sigma factor RsiW
MKADDCRGWRENLGALALDQLDDDERAATEAHLEGCAECRAELDLLVPVAAALPLADPAQLATPPTPPRSLARSIARSIAAERRARRRRRLSVGGGALAAACAAAAVAAILLAGGGGSTPSPAPSSAREVAFTTVPRGVKLDARLQPRPWGSEISLEVRGITPGTRCEVWLRRADGTRVPAGSFRYRYEGGSDEAALSSALPPSQARAIAIRAGDRTFVARIA